MTAPIAVLVSYHFWRDLDLDEHFARWPTHPVVFADSGAFSAFTSGAVVDVHEYAAWLDRWRHHFAVACTLDVIHDEVATEANTAILEDHGHRVLPVFHTQEPWEYLERLCDRYPYVGLGGMVPFKIRRNALARWLVKCFRTGVADGTVFHGLGLTSPDLLALLPFYSVDSSGWCEGLQYGKVRVFDPLRARPRVVQAGDRRALLHGEAFRAVGVDPHALATPYFGRRHPDGNKPVEQARAEADLEGAANIASTWQHAEWWHARHAPVALDGMPDGPVMFLVAINPRDLSRIREHFYPTTDTQEAQHDGATSPA